MAGECYQARTSLGALSGKMKGNNIPDDSERQLSLLRACSGVGMDISINSSKNTQSQKRPVEDLLEARAQPDYKQFIQGLTKTAANAHE